MGFTRHSVRAGHRPAGTVSQILNRNGWRVSNDRRHEGLRVRGAGDATSTEVRISLDLDGPDDWQPMALLEILALLTTRGYRVRSMEANRDTAWAVVDR